MYGQYPDQHDGGDGDDQPDEDDGEGMVRVVMMMMMAVVVMFSQLTRLSCSVKWLEGRGFIWQSPLWPWISHSPHLGLDFLSNLALD